MHAKILRLVGAPRRHVLLLADNGSECQLLVLRQSELKRNHESQVAATVGGISIDCQSGEKEYIMHTLGI